MSSNIEDSLVLITSKDDKLKRNFGTGFVIYQDGEDTYVITCDHVLRDVGGIEKVLVRGIAATLVVSGESQGFDLAVLKVQGLSNVSVLTLCSSTEFEKQSFEITGYFSYDHRETRLSKKISGYLGKSGYISSHDGSDHIKSWDLHIKDNDRLKPGYSGSPVIDRMGDVLGIVSHLVSDGSCGLAISIEGIQKVWTEMPSELYKNRSSSHNDDLDLINENPSEYLPTKFCLRSLLYLFILLIFMSISIAYSYHFFSSDTWKKAYRELGWIIEMLRAVIAVAVMAGLINIIFPIEFCEIFKLKFRKNVPIFNEKLLFYARKLLLLIFIMFLFIILNHHFYVGPKILCNNSVSTINFKKECLIPYICYLPYSVCLVMFILIPGFTVGIYAVIKDLILLKSQYTNLLNNNNHNKFVEKRFEEFANFFIIKIRRYTVFSLISGIITLFEYFVGKPTFSEVAQRWTYLAYFFIHIILTMLLLAGFYIYEGAFNKFNKHLIKIDYEKISSFREQYKTTTMLFKILEQYLLLYVSLILVSLVFIHIIYIEITTFVIHVIQNNTNLM